MSHKFSLAYLTVPGLTPPEQIHVAAKTGYDYVSLRLYHLNVPGEPDIDPVAPQSVRETKQALSETGIQVLDIELVRILRSIDVKEFLPSFEAGAELGATQVICSAWTDVRNDRSFIVDSFSQICDLATPFGLTVNLEFPAFSRLASLEDCVEILEFADRPNQGLLVDTLYMHFNKTPIFAMEKVPSRWINFMHICDANDLPYTRDEMIHIARDARLYPGEGAIDFSTINYMFPDLPLSIELPHKERMAEFGPEQHARNCIEAARGLLNPNAAQSRDGTRG
ncbi:MAG: sugar phosphate isomerase/epimerase family protein [Rhodomicrobiaceae bacterium]